MGRSVGGWRCAPGVPPRLRSGGRRWIRTNDPLIKSCLTEAVALPWRRPLHSTRLQQSDRWSLLSEMDPYGQSRR
jgi:hypothetical protein